MKKKINIKNFIKKILKLNELMLNKFLLKIKKYIFIILNYFKVKRFYENEMLFNIKIQKIIKKKHPLIDWYFLNRFNSIISKNQNIDINNFYFMEDELRFDNLPYQEFFKCLDQTFLNKFNSYLDIGCATGNLIKEIKKNYSNSSVTGIDYFQFHKDYADKSISSNIIIADISKKTNINNRYEIVICTEVAEHIHPNNIHIFLKNLNKLTSRKLILSWSNTFPNPDAPPQHLCCLDKYDVLKLLDYFGFTFNNVDTKKFINISNNYNNFHYWWRDSLLVFDKKY